MTNKSIFSFLTLFFILFKVSAQEFVGYNYNNYQTVAGATFNPANMANSKYKLDINILSVSVYEANNAIEIHRSKMFDKLVEGENFFKLNDNKAKHVSASIDILGPGFMINLGRNWGAIGITSRARTVVSGKNFSNDIFQLFGEGDKVDFYGKMYSQNDLKVDIHSFSDLGLSYARTIWQNKTNVITGGFTAKFVKGIGASSFRVDKAKVMIDLGQIDPSKPTTTDVEKIGDLDGDLTLMYTNAMDVLVNGDGFDEAWNKSKNDNGFGFDLGFAYEWYTSDRQVPEDQKSIWTNNRLTPYQFRVSLAVTDIGSIKYSPGRNARSFKMQKLKNISLDDLDVDLNSFDEYIDFFTDSLQILRGLNKPTEYKIMLPTTLRANVDWKAYKAIYVNAGANINMLGKNSFGAGYQNFYYITPRYETKWFSASSPVSINSYGQFAWGLGINAGPIFFGSGSILSNLTKSKLQHADVYFGMHIPIFQKTAKAPPVKQLEPIVELDSDKDGIIDRLDKCPFEFGVEKYEGCPIPDTDKDGINDDDDKCPEIAGLAQYAGCPIPDTDGDGINDQEDHCPEVFGFTRYLGCPIPDTDGDGINDEEDKCIDEPGVPENKGCPVIAKEIEAKVNMAAKQILFATGSDKLLAKSFPALDQVVMLMFANKSIKMDIEGHTDATGKAQSNLSLSDKRAKAVKTYLETKGIDAQRLISTGYGQTKPIADNKTSAGRSKNRRVEIKLHY